MSYPRRRSYESSTRNRVLFFIEFTNKYVVAMFSRSAFRLTGCKYEFLRKSAKRNPNEETADYYGNDNSAHHVEEKKPAMRRPPQGTQSLSLRLRSFPHVTISEIGRLPSGYKSRGQQLDQHLVLAGQQCIPCQAIVTMSCSQYGTPVLFCRGAHLAKMHLFQHDEGSCVARLCVL